MDPWTRGPALGSGGVQPTSPSETGGGSPDALLGAGREAAGLASSTADAGSDDGATGAPEASSAPGWATPAVPTAWRPPEGRPPVRAVLRVAFEAYARRLVPLLALGALVAASSTLVVAAQIGGTGLWPLAVLGVVLSFVVNAMLVAVAAGVLREPEVAEGQSIGRGLRRSLHYLASSILIGVAMVGVSLVAIVLPLAVLFGLIASRQGLAAIGLVLLLSASAFAMVAALVVGTRLVLAWPALILEGHPVIGSLSDAWARTAGRKVFVALSVGLPYLLYSTMAGAAGVVATAWPIGALVVAFVPAAILVPYAACALAATDRVLRATETGSVSSPAGAPIGAMQGEVAPTRATAGARRATSALIGLAVVVGVVSWVAGIAGTASVAGDLAASQGSVRFGTAGSGCAIRDERTSFEVGDSVHLVASLSRSVPAGSTIDERVYLNGRLAGQGSISAEQAADCVYGDLATDGYEPGRYLFEYRLGDELLAEGDLELVAP